MSQKEAQARIKINKLLEEAGWRFFKDENGPANVILEGGITLDRRYLNQMGEDFENTKKGFIDYELLDARNRIIGVLEAKRESINPLTAKEQARHYAQSVGARFIILSNGNLHYLWDLEKGNPHVITKFPGPESLTAFDEFEPDKNALISEPVGEGYIALTQLPNYQSHPEWKGLDNSKVLFDRFKLRFLRGYQIRAVKAIQEAAAEGKERFLFEMATGTGKTLTSAAIIKLFLRTENARRVLFLVDRLELEDQARKNFTDYLGKDYSILVLKESKNQEDWRNAEILVTTIQTLMSGDRYKQMFAPTDFDLLISDEAHRSIGGNSRAVFEYFHGYKLGLTATPKDYLKGIDADEIGLDNPREMELRMLRDTYITFGCENGEPTFRYSLVDGVKDGFLRNPITVDARTEITTQLLSDQGYAVSVKNEDGDEETQVFVHRDFEKKFFSTRTNKAFCTALMENALRDPISNEMGKTIIFCVSQAHALKITEILNDLAEQKWPGKYNSDFAVQVTSNVPSAQDMTIQFSNDKLNGSSKWLDGYKSSKTRICVTVGMMATGYDCPNILNLGMMRPIFSPSDFVQIKGRGTRTHTFYYELKNELGEREVVTYDKKNFKLFDFFANCEYFEEKFDYGEKLKVVMPAGEGMGGEGPHYVEYESAKDDIVTTWQETEIGLEGMRIDRELFMQRAEDRVRSDERIKTLMEAGNWDQINHYIKQEIFDKPEEYLNLEKIRKAAGLDRKISIREFVEKVFGIIPKFKEKDELLEEEFQKFVSIYPPDEKANVTALKQFFKAYIIDQDLRKIIKNQEFQELYHHPILNMEDFKAVAPRYRQLIPVYVHDYVPLDKYAA
jgi:type I restriction enzyme, R subunit